ncbi:hypothetical protein Mal64_30180 [Pseudobythopirellula maris]|uniref:Ice-binding protein C-terminal domain-containing protein n=2 Tax=Pseudobythopirellula maris TaxID=2527991 RepID=A0A5C5ZJE6_9BACT|nr:hypothetical protein Mal64_30180 [Pseudobythopirellula maris]
MTRPAALVAPVAPAVAPLAIAVVVLVATSTAALAAQIDLSLNLLHNGAVASNGGSWELVAKADGGAANFGLMSLSVPLRGVNTTIASGLPSGTVNGDDSAGFGLFSNTPTGSGRLITAAQTPVMPDPDSRVFFGVGTVENGTPAPRATLAGLINSPWATGDTFGDSDWDVAVTVATGTFAAGADPRFGLASLFDAFVFDDMNSVPSFSSDTIFSTLIRTNISGSIANGDYNENGFVDAADFTVWRDAMGTGVAPGTSADGTGDGMIDDDDYDLWVANFGLEIPAPSLATSSSSSLAVPEPGTAWLTGLAVGAIGLLLREKRAPRAALAPACVRR